LEELAEFEFPLRGTTTLAELEDMYGIMIDTGRELTLDKAIRRQLGGSLAISRSARFGPISLRVRRVTADKSAGWDDNTTRTGRRRFCDRQQSGNS
jgi:hypothetical protein